jgi:hypothetical protein
MYAEGFSKFYVVIFNSKPFACFSFQKFSDKRNLIKEPKAAILTLKMNAGSRL